MKNSTRVVLAILCVFFSLSGIKVSAQATAPFTHQGLKASTGDYLGFLQYKPADYDLHPNTKYPLIIFLHGIGERGNGTTELDKVAYVGLPRIIYKGNKMNFTWNGKTETFIVLAPQCPMKYGMWPAAFVNDLIAYAKQNLHIDEDRIYLTGLSMGGGGSLRYISDALPDNAKNLAAVATIAAPCTFRTGQYAAQAHLPIWSFHAEDDPIASVQCTKNAIAGLNQWNLSPKPLLNLWPTGGHIVWDRVYTDTNYQYQGVVNIYEWFLGQNRKYAVNQLPKANAGGDKSVTGNTIVLDASASSDNDGKLVRYVWKKLSGPACGKIVAPMSANASTTYTGVTIPGKYTFEVAVVDDRASFTRDTVTFDVTSVAAASPAPVKDTVKTPPVKDTVAVPVKDTVTTPVITKPGTSVKDTVTTNPVKDSVSNPGKSPVTTTPPVVKDTVPSKPTAPATGNKAPYASAGVDVTTNTGWPQSLINATLSKDSDGWITKVRWSKVGGPASYSIDDSTKLQTHVRNLAAGVYTFRVTVTDNKGASSSAQMTITVNAPKAKVIPANVAPVANAGVDAVIPTSWNRNILNSTLSKDPDGWITAVKWSKVSGPSAYKIMNAVALQTYATDLVEGVYVFRVTVTDNRGASSSADMKITVVKPNSKTSTVASSATIANAATIGNDLSIAETSKANVKPGLSNIGSNPAFSTLQLQISSEAMGQTNITVYDLNGRVIKNVVASKSQATLQQTIAINDLTPGVYYAVAKTGTNAYAPVKFIKQ